MIRFGHDKTMLYRSYQVYRDTTITIRSLNQGQLYWFAIDAFGETGITRGDTLEGAVNSGCMAVPYVNINGAAWQQVATSTLNSGGTLILGPQPLDGTWSWTGPSGYTATNREISFTNIEAGQAGSYIGSYTSPTGCKATATFTINVNGSNGCALAPIVPYMKVNTGGWQQINTASISAGGTIFMGPQPGDGTWSWAGSSGYTSTVREITLTNVQAAQAGQYKASYTNPAGCKGVVTFTVTLLKNAKVIDEVNGTSEIACFPNPADNFVALKNIAANTNITIFGTNGRLVLRTIVSANENINVSSLSPGVYFIKTVNQSLKLVKR